VGENGSIEVSSGRSLCTCPTGALNINVYRASWYRSSGTLATWWDRLGCTLILWALWILINDLSSSCRIGMKRYKGTT
jgi:hypothetical protein